MKQINLNILEDGSTGLSRRVGGFLGEAASVCFKHNGHPSVVNLPSDGHFAEVYEITCYELTDRSIDSFADIQEATEYGACGVALSILTTETPFKAKRSWKGTGFDYWLGISDEGYPFQDSARLEVSGIITGTDNQIQKRLKDKLDQTSPSDPTGLPAFAVVVEFGNPKTLTGKR